MNGTIQITVRNKNLLPDDKRQTNQTNTNEPKVTDGKLRSYLYRFTIRDHQTCRCQTGSQNSEHLIRECPIPNKVRDTLINRIINKGGRWPLTNSELVNKHMYLFQKFVNSINFEDLQRHKGNKSKKRTQKN